MERIIDCKGLNCPQPVINTKKALDEIQEGRVITIVDNEVAKENVRKLAEKLNVGVEIEEQEGLYRLILTKGDRVQTEKVVSSVMNQQGGFVILIGTDKMGSGSEELGSILMNSYLYTLSEIQPRPDCLIFLNDGVKLACSGSKSLEHIKKLEELGVEILSCGTCLDFYGLKEQLQVGAVSNMYTIVESLNEAAKSVVI